MTTSPRHRTLGRSRGTIVVALAVTLTALTGCSSRMRFDPEAFRTGQTLDKIVRIDDVKGPLERQVTGNRDRGRDGGIELVSGYGDMHSLRPMEGLEELEAARKIYDAGEYGDAIKAFKKVAKAYEDSPVEEDALFYIAECRFQMRHFAKAQDAYAQLLQDYPSTRHVETSTKRLFEIGREWLGFPKIVEANEVQQVNFEKPAETPAPNDDREYGWDPTRRVPVLPNFWDKSRPTFDTSGRGLEALRSIWLNDPTGPLADDALMLTASHHLRQGNYADADRLFKTLREEYPKSPHLEKAFILGGHTKLVAYGGADYDGRALTDAEALKGSANRLFPNNPLRGRIDEDLRRIQLAKIERDWGMVEFYRRKGRDRAVAMYCREIIRQWPESQRAAEARELLRELDPEAVRLATPVRPPEEPSVLQRLTRPLRLRPTPDDAESEERNAPGGATLDPADTEPMPAPGEPRVLPPLEEPRRTLDPTPRRDRRDIIEAGGTGRARL